MYLGSCIASIFLGAILCLLAGLEVAHQTRVLLDYKYFVWYGFSTGFFVWMPATILLNVAAIAGILMTWLAKVC